VEWLRSGSRYQCTWRSVSDELRTADQPSHQQRRRAHRRRLSPLRFDEETHVALRPSKQVTIHFDEDTIRLPAAGSSAPPGVQDTASQFVQLTWMFTMQPQLLQPGRSITLPLALPRRVDDWTYDVMAHETLETPVGSIATLHVKPRRAPKPGVDSAPSCGWRRRCSTCRCASWSARTPRPDRHAGAAPAAAGRRKPRPPRAVEAALQVERGGQPPGSRRHRPAIA